ncbi:MAG: DUF2065 domain-containing protein [Pseudomonadota bacterium]
MTDFVAALGLVLVIEGVLYALAPETMRRFILSLASEPINRFRAVGLGMAVVGVGIVWLVRG